jgi:ribosome-associated protein
LLELKALKDLVVDALEDVKGFDITVLDVRNLTSMTSYMIICSATSTRQTKALADHVRVKVKEQGIDIRGFEGERGGEWVLVDLDDIVVHIMVPATRAYYNLEQLWSKDNNGENRHITPDNLNPATT